MIKVHASHPLATIKLLVASQFPGVATTLSLRHASLASHTPLHAIPQGSWLAVTRPTKNRVGTPRDWRLNRRMIESMSLSPFVLEDGCPTNEDEFPPQAFLQSKQAFDLAVLLPDARLIYVEFNNQPRTLQWASSWVMERFSSSFAGEPPGLWSPCHCRGHWLRLDGRAVVQPGQGLTILALSHRIVDLGPPRREAKGPKAPLALLRRGSPSQASHRRAPQALRRSSRCQAHSGLAA